MFFSMVGKVEEEKMMKCHTSVQVNPAKIFCVFIVSHWPIISYLLFFFFFKLQPPKKLKCYVLKYTVEAKMVS